jgi:hypothetical protein
MWQSKARVRYCLAGEYFSREEWLTLTTVVFACAENLLQDWLTMNIREFHTVALACEVQVKQ